MPSGLVRFQVHVLRFLCQVRTPLTLGAYKGSALRGALFEALRSGFCLHPDAALCRDCPTQHECPVSALLAPLDNDGSRGQDPPRPYVIKPPTDGRVGYSPGDSLEFRIALFGVAATLAPYVVLGVQAMGARGLGKARGRFALREVWAENDFAGTQERIMQAGVTEVRVPSIPVTHSDVAARASRWGSSRLRLRLRTPLRLVTGQHLLRELRFATLIRRLLERLSAVTKAYSGEQVDLPFRELLEAAEMVPVAQDSARWFDVDRYSTRHGRHLPMGGLLGEVVIGGDWRPFREFLAWAELVHVGKYAVLGNGWIDVAADGPATKGW